MPASSIFLRRSSEALPSSSPSSRRMDSICLRRTYSRCCFWAPSSTSSRMRLRTWSSARRSRWSSSASSRRAPASRGPRRGALCPELEAGLDVERLEQADLLLEGQVGGVAGRVGERAGVADRAQPGGDAAVVAAELEDLLDGRAVLALERAQDARGHPARVLVLDDLD